MYIYVSQEGGRSIRAWPMRAQGEPTRAQPTRAQKSPGRNSPEAHKGPGPRGANNGPAHKDLATRAHRGPQGPRAHKGPQPTRA